MLARSHSAVLSASNNSCKVRLWDSHRGSSVSKTSPSTRTVLRCSAGIAASQSSVFTTSTLPRRMPGGAPRWPKRSDRPRWNFQAVIAIVGQFNGGFEMKTLAAIITALALISVPAVAQMTGAPGAAQSDPAKPGMGNPDQSAMRRKKRPA